MCSYAHKYMSMYVYRRMIYVNENYFYKFINTHKVNKNYFYKFINTCEVNKNYFYKFINTRTI